MSQGKVSVVMAACNEGDNLVNMMGCILEKTIYPSFQSSLHFLPSLGATIH